MRTKQLFNSDWTFEKEGKLESIKLPHTWNAIDGQGQSDYFRGICIYRKTFSQPQISRDQRVYIEFRGVNASAEVLINQTKVSSHDGGYSTFRADLTDYLQEENELCVIVDNGVNDRVYPQRADFTFYGGIYRDVNLLVVNKNHFDLDYFGGSGLYLTPTLNGSTAKVDISAYFTGNADEIRVSIPEVGKVSLSIEGNKASGSIEIENVHRWDGLRDPYLYSAQAELIVDGQVVDQVTECFGCREYYVDPEKGFFLNGRSYPLHGVSRHQDRLGVGNALTREMHEEDMELILSMGSNSIRLAHYQHDQYFYDLCDQKGLIVWAEIPYITIHMKNGRENTISQMKELIVQNYNHASIICWALSNEITLNGVTEDLMENHRILNDMVHRMDPGRLSAMANLFLLETDSPLVTLPDLRGYNLYYGWYVGEKEDNDTWFDEFHKSYPDVAIGLTEYGADSVITLQSPKPEKGDYTESYQALYHEHMLEMFSTRPYIWGTYCWNMFEFAAAGRDEAGDPGKNHKGLITFDRKEKKDAYYIYKAWWTDQPFVHLCGKRYHDRIEENTQIKVYSNCSSVTLFVDEKEIETVNGKYVFTFTVPISGHHTIKAVSGDQIDTMEIRKTDHPNPAYFASAEKVRNWFDEPEEEVTDDNFLSLNSTMAEVQATEAGKAIMEQMMKAMQDKTAGGMGKNVALSNQMLAMIARQPLKKLLVQGGMDLESEEARMLQAALTQIPKNKNSI